MTTQQPEALPALIERFRGLHFDHAPDGWPAVRTREITALLDRITELESQLAQRFDAADMATAAAQGFRDGVASVSAGSGPVAWQYRSVRDKGLWFDCTEERAQQRAAHPDKWDVRYLYTHPSPPEGMAGRMPIETAPKDGSRILLHPAVEVADDWSKGHWNSEHECWIVGGSPSGVVHTAWHPLPPAPSTEGESNDRLATHALRASRGQAPAGAGEAAEHYRNAIARARLLDSDLSNLTERGAKAWAGVDAQGLRDGSASPSANAGEPSAHIKEPYTLAEIKAKIASNDYSAEMLLQHAMLLLDSVQEDAARLDWLEQHDGRYYNLDKVASIVGTGFLVQSEGNMPQVHSTLREAVDAARKQGATQ